MRGTQSSRREEWKAAVGGGVAFAILHFAFWRWPQLQALFHGDEQEFVIAAAGAFVAFAWIYLRIGRARRRRVLAAMDPEDAEEQDEERSSSSQLP